jgi:probable HAF family extracellular repeat protein
VKSLGVTIIIAVVGTLIGATTAAAATYTVTPVGPVGGVALDINGVGEVSGSGGEDPYGGQAEGWVAGPAGVRWTDCTFGPVSGKINSYGVAAGRMFGVGESFPCGLDYRADSEFGFNSWSGDACVEAAPPDQAEGIDGGAVGINDRGDLVGWCEADAFIWQKTDTGYKGIRLAPGVANDSAARGEAVGARSSSGYTKAFRYVNGTMRILGTLGGNNSAAFSVSGTGYIAGWAQKASGRRHAFRWISGTMRDLGTLGGGTSQANSVNGNGHVVGWAKTGSGVQHAFLWKNGTMYDLNKLIPSGSGWKLVEATGNNGKGKIVGWGYRNGSLQGFFLTPVG